MARMAVSTTYRMQPPILRRKRATIHTTTNNKISPRIEKMVSNIGNSFALALIVYPGQMGIPYYIPVTSSTE
jgi:hypothetical protein